jgi:hypothetical protein
MELCEDTAVAANAGLWTLHDMVPKIVVTNAELDVHGMAQYFEELHRDDSVDVVRFLRKFVRGTKVSDLQRLAAGWTDLTVLDHDRNAARGRQDSKEFERITGAFTKIGVALKDTSDPKSGKITTFWQVRGAGPAEVVA